MKKKTTNLWKRIAITTALILSFGLTAFADENVPTDDPARFVKGTTVNNVLIEGLTVDEAKLQLETSYHTGYKLTLLEKDKKKEVITGPEIGYQVIVPEGLQPILDEQNATGRKSGPSIDNSHLLVMAVTYDEAALQNRISALSCLSGDAITVTSNARISPYQEGQPFTIIKEIQGNSVNQDRLTAAIKVAIDSAWAEMSLQDTGCYDTVQITSDSPELKNQLQIMNQCREMIITYVLGETTEELTGETICAWLTGTGDDGQIEVDEEDVAAYIRELASRYDTAGTYRTFHTATGKDVNLTGPFGRKMDQAAEVSALIGMIRTAQTQTRVPQFSQGSAEQANDWGDTYVEIDLTGQHVYMFQDGNLVWDAPCVTGNVSKGYTTPPGIYSLYYKQTDRILRGAKQSDGSYEYESHVDYWMPFNNGIGLHDADWRSKFGGTIYQYGGSHGCINLPPSKAKVLYGLVYAGIPVICYD